MPTTAKMLIENLQTASQNTPYRIEPTNVGFNLVLNIVDAKWYTILQKNSITETFKIEAKLNEATQVATTTDVLNSLAWSAGVPYVGAKTETARGEIYRFSTRKEIGVSETAKVGVAVEYSFNTLEAKRWLDSQLEKNGWKRSWGAIARLGLVMAIIGVLVAIACIVLALLFA